MGISVVVAFDLFLLKTKVGATCAERVAPRIGYTG